MKSFLVFFLTALAVFAQGPPAPPTIVYGNVRDLSGIVIDDPLNTAIVLFADGSEVGRASLEPHPTLNENYRISFSNSGIPSSAEFTVKIERDGVLLDVFALDSGFASFQALAATLKRFDFVEGSDSDDDGLPDEWELTQLSEIGSADLSLITGEGDFDSDGLTDNEEFVTGTLATVFASRVNFKTNGILGDDWISVSFDTQIGREYQLLVSTDVDQFTPVEMAVNDDRTNLVSTYIATTQERITVTSAPIAGASVFYRVSVK